MTSATFAMGCFWKPEAIFRARHGVLDTRVGYAGGHVENPTYPQVCGGQTGHAEAVRVVFDPTLVGYADLLTVFWAHHDPTTRNRQGPDIGRQYRSVIFVVDEAQRALARASLDAEQARLNRPITTDIETLTAFYQAEAYHQRYLEKTGAVCL
ncbi:peptide-methionine (S)-S-oxide reductase MsrA [Salinisphaera sp. Q1T1-3]|uniref:peptide-methionine (S)-S-oxide reductase MsrA n=1 Tax=Salinisphaera sp. Q1T1-3 TaxID=2321229 RepID=UPI000E72C5A1|nr:peptide-methionine (S)-S-oxide reductase MsrA [Salinisphaera sp. Q1T1-3]RJS92495.1 peptide-methionine (S)-S-oxide reductase [Salinisphaera sp. Q1T1-3]